MPDALDLGTWQIVVRLVLAALLAGLIGLERELDGHEAGVRTHALLATGAALFGAISVGAFAPYVAARDATNVQVDVTRVASYVAAGVGFLGGGVIVKRGQRARGLTTAASLWSATAVGLAAGLGFWAGAVTTTVLSLALLLLERPLRALRRRAHPAGDPAAGDDDGAAD